MVVPSDHAPLPASPGPRPRRWPRLLLAALLGLLAAELASRIFWRVRHGVALAHPERILHGYYPELEAVDRAAPRAGDGCYDVLLLGASSLDPDWGAIEAELRAWLAPRARGALRVFNLGRPAHTSRDNLLKYAALGAARFELVIFYDGINEARANNVPPELFREDYGHYSWYRMVNHLAPYHGRAVLALPYTLGALGVALGQARAQGRSVPTHAPRADWVAFGRDLRSAAAFERNLTAILDLAAAREDPVVLMTFAIHVPADYTPESFAAGRLDYARHRIPIELWGERGQVQAAVAAHNDVVRRLAAGHAGVRLIDQARLIPGSGRCFDDPCHLTAEGSRRWVEHLAAALPDALAPR